MPYERVNRPGMMIYHDDYELTLRPLPPESRANIIEAIMNISMALAAGQELPPDPQFPFPDSIAFGMMKKKVMTDQVRYEDRCEKNRQNRAMQEKRKLEKMQKADILEKENAQLRKQIDDSQRLSRNVDECRLTTTITADGEETAKDKRTKRNLNGELSEAAKAAIVTPAGKSSKSGSKEAMLLLQKYQFQYSERLIHTIIDNFSYKDAASYLEMFSKQGTDEAKVWNIINQAIIVNKNHEQP